MSLPKKRRSSRLRETNKLFDVIHKNDVKSVKLCLRSQGFSAESIIDTYERTALHIAASIGNESIVDILLKQQQIQVTIFDQHKNTPLHFAAENGNVPVFMKLLNALRKNDNAANINVKNNQWETPLHTAVYKGHVNLVERMIKTGADVNAAKYDGGTPLHLAAAMGHPQIVKILLRHDANPNARTNRGSTPLHCVAFDRLYDKMEPMFWKMSRRKLNDDEQEVADQKEVVSILLNSGVNPNELNSELVSPLLCAVRRNHLVLMKALLEGGATVDFWNFSNKSALHYAAMYGTPQVIRILLDYGANVNLLSIEGFTPLHYAVRNNNHKSASILINNGADVNKKAENGETVLLQFLFFAHENVTLFQLLVESGININDQHSITGHTFIHYLNDLKYEKLFAICMELNIDCNVEASSNNRTPLEQLVYTNSVLRIWMLLIKLMAKMEKDKKIALSEKNRLIINNIMPTFYKKCQNELEQLKKIVWGNINFYDLLNKSLRDLSDHIRNKKLLAILDLGVCKQFKIYGEMVEIRMRIAFARMEIFDKCVQVLISLFSPKYGRKLPYLFSVGVIKFLNIVDMENLALSVKNFS